MLSLPSGIQTGSVETHGDDSRSNVVSRETVSWVRGLVSWAPVFAESITKALAEPTRA